MQNPNSLRYQESSSTGETGSRYLVFVRRKAVPDTQGPGVKVGEHRFDAWSQPLGSGRARLDPLGFAGHDRLVRSK